MTLLEDEPLVLEDIDLSPECIWEVPPCEATATWWVRWSCGCVAFYCDEHVDKLTDILCDEGHDAMSARQVERGRL